MQLHRVCTHGRPAEVRRLIQAGHNVNAYDESGWTPLLTAAYHGNELTAREVIRGNADVHFKVKGSGKSALYTAAYYICQAWVKFYLLVMFILRMGEQAAAEMVRPKADNDWKSKESGRTALHIAAYYGHQSLVKLFLETEVNINEQDDEGRIALMLAVERGHSAVVAELVKAGADIGLKDKKGMTAVLLAKSYDMVVQLVRDVDDLSREDRSYILWHACDFGDLSMVLSVIEAGCDGDHIHKGQTPVMMATLRGHDSIVKELILANCDVNLHSKVYYSDLASSLNMARMLWPMGLLWLVTVFGFWVPWTTDRTGVVVERSTTAPVWSLMLTIALSVMAVVGVLLVPGSGNVMLVGSGVVSMMMIFIVRVVLMAGQVVSAVFVILMVVAFLVIMTSDLVNGEFVKNTATAVMLICAHVVLQLLTNSVWSVSDAVMVGAVIVIAIVAVTFMVWKGMKAALQRRVVTLAEGVLVNVELFVITAVCVRIGRGGFAYIENTAVWMLMDILVMMVFMGVPLVVLRTQSSTVTIFRGVTVFFAFEATRWYKMGNVEDRLKAIDVPLEALDDTAYWLVLVVLVMARIFSVLLPTITKKSVLLRGMMVLHLVVVVAEVYLAVLLSSEGIKLRSWARELALYMNLIVVIMMMTPIKASNATAMHYAAGHNHVQCAVLLAEAGGDVRAKNKRLHTPFEFGSSAFHREVKQVLSFTTTRVIAVIGNSEHGKSTLVAALECTSDILWKKTVNHYRKVHDIRQRTAGIEAVQVSNPKYGEALFYDFAGQSQYHGPHQSFLEAMLSKPEASVTLMLLVKATEDEDIITQQLHRWLQPLALMSIPITPQVIVVGSFLDQVKSEKEASEKLLRCTQSVKTELALDIQAPCLLDCRQPESKGIDQICTFLQEARPVNTKALSYCLHWVLVQVRKAFSIPAVRLYEFQTWLQDNAGNLPRSLPSPEEVCHDLSAAGHTLFIVNKEHLSKSWLILDLPGLLHKVYGTLFSGSQNMYSASKFGLLHCSQLNELFPKMYQVVIQEVLKCLEFCIQIDPALLEEELLQLCMVEGGEGWLYFPALVLAQPSNVFPEDLDPEQFQWLCWQLRTTEKHFISAHLLQTIILRLAANHVFTHELAPRVRKHCCCVWVNGISWRSTKGVDIAVQLNDSSVVQVVGRSKAGSERLHRYTSTVVRDIIKTTTQLSPKLEATPYIIHPYTPTSWKDPKAIQTDSLYPVSSITRCISNGDDHVLPLPKKDGDHPQQMSLSEVFGWLPSLEVVQAMDFADPSSSSAGEWNAASVLPFQLPSSLCNQKQLVVIAQTYMAQDYRSVCSKVFAK